MRRSAFIAVLFFLVSQKASGALNMMGGMGLMAGTFTKTGSPMSSQGYLYSFLLSWNPEFTGKPWSLLIGGQIKQAKFSFKESGINKRGTYNLYGGHLGYFYALTPNWRWQLSGEYYGDGQLAVLSSNNVLTNGRSYRYSSFERYSGKAASGLRFQLSHDRIDGQFSAKNRYRSGGGITYLQQTFQRESAQITNSDADLRPERTFSSADVDFRIQVIAIDLFIGLTF